MAGFIPQFCERWRSGLVIADQNCVPADQALTQDTWKVVETLRTKVVVQAALLVTGLKSVYQLEMAIGPRAYDPDGRLPRTTVAESRLRILSRWRNGTSTIQKRPGNISRPSRQLLESLSDRDPLIGRVLNWPAWRLMANQPTNDDLQPSSPLVEDFLAPMNRGDLAPSQASRQFTARLLAGIHCESTRYTAIEALLLMLSLSRVMDRLPPYALCMLVWSRARQTLQRDPLLGYVADELFSIVNAQFGRIALRDESLFTAWMSLSNANLQVFRLSDGTLWVAPNTQSLVLRRRLAWRFEPPLSA